MHDQSESMNGRTQPLMSSLTSPGNLPLEHFAWINAGTDTCQSSFTLHPFPEQHAAVIRY